MQNRFKSIPLDRRKRHPFFAFLATNCLLCHQPQASKYSVCEDCLSLFKPLGRACLICRTPLGEDTSEHCGQCLRHQPVFDHLYTAFRYTEPLRTVLHEFKYREGLYLGHLITELMLKAIPTNYQADCLIPVPIHPQRLKQRGFNQAAILCRLLAKRLQLPYDLACCYKIKNTHAQALLNRRTREKNLKEAFSVKSCTYKQVTLVDDLFTTGSTASEISRLLKNQGVSKVDIWCCARAVS